MSESEDNSRAVIARLARPHPSGGYVIGEASIRAEGSTFPALKAWILAHGGTPDSPVAVAAGRGLHGSRRIGDTDAQAAGRSSQYVLPASALV